LTLAALAAAVAASATPWSAPAALSPCRAAGAPQVVFPSDSPSQGTGTGAVVWSAAAGCVGGEGARVAGIGTGDVPGASAVVRNAIGRPLAAHGPLLASGAPHGQIVIAGSAPGDRTAGVLIQGAAGGPFTALAPEGTSAAPVAFGRAYLGDVALASASAPAPTPTPAPARASGGRLSATGGFAVHVERFYAHRFGREVSVPSAGSAPVRELTLAMDYRSEVLAVWVQGGVIYARLLPNDGAARPLQRLARVGEAAHVAALLSDDGRAIVAWSERHGEQTRVYIDRSGAGVRFRAAQLLESFSDPDGLGAPAASPSLVRLSSESVMLAWAGAEGGHWVVRTAPVYMGGVGVVGTIAAPGADLLLDCLAAGPAADALLLWTQPPPSAGAPPALEHESIFAATGFDAGDRRTAFGAPQLVAAPAPVDDLSGAFDPDSDRAVAVWQGQGGRIEYSVRGQAGTP
jgi:hypothetical protein